MRVLVFGGRFYQDRDGFYRAMDLLHAKIPLILVIHGACPIGEGGADWLADDWAKLRGVPVQPCAVDHALDGPWPGAGPRRNKRMLDTYPPDAGVGFPGDRGTRNMAKRLTEAGMKIWWPYGRGKA